MSIVKKLLVIFSIVGSIAAMSGALPQGVGTPIVARAQEALQETQAQQFAKEQIKRRRDDLRSLFETQRAKFAEQLQQGVQSEVKIQLALRAADIINDINERKTAEYLERVGMVESMLRSMMNDIDLAGQQGANVDNVWPKVQEADVAIVEARSRAVSQAGIIYNIEGADETALRMEINNARNALHTDISEVREFTKKAHRAVVDVIITFNSEQ